MARAPRSFVSDILATAIPTDVTALSDEDAFRQFTAALTVRGMSFGVLVVLAVDVAWMVVDPFVFRGFAAAASGFAWMRVYWVVALSLTYLALRLPLVFRWPTLVVGAISVFHTAGVGWFAAGLGGLEAPWFHLAYPVTFFSAFLVTPLRGRLLVAPLFPAALLLGAALSPARLLGSPLLRVTLGYLVFLSVVTVAAGHLIYLLIQQTFAQARAHLRASSALAELNDTLEARVREQTSELRLLAAHVEGAREEERTRLSRELHDELGQELTALRYALTLTRQRYARDPASIPRNLADLEGLVARTTTITRQIVSDLRPRVLDDLGLAAAVEWLLRRAEERGGIPGRLVTSGPELVVDAEIATVAYRIAQESLTNVVRHARASRVEVELALAGGELTLRVSDDGVGPPARGERGAGMGLVGMRERAEGAGGRFRLRGAPGQGTIVDVVLPAQRAGSERGRA
jgi:signal transduction histidine kinase